MRSVLDSAVYYFECAEMHRREGRADQAAVNEEESWFQLFCWASEGPRQQTEEDRHEDDTDSWW